MPTLGERLDGALEGEEATLRISVQTETLAGLAETVRRLADDPPDSVADLAGSLETLPLPELGLGSGLTLDLRGIKAALPAASSDLTNDLDGVLTSLAGAAGDVNVHIGTAVSAAVSIYELSRLDLICGPGADGPSAGEEGGAEGDGGGDGGTGDGEPAPAEEGVGTTPSGVPGNAAHAIAEADGALSVLPSPLTVEGLISWLYEVTDRAALGHVGLGRVPVLGELHDPLETVVRWQSLDGAGIVAHMEGSLQALDGLLRSVRTGTLGALRSELDLLVAAVPFPDLERIADDVADHLGTLAAAVEAGDVSGTDPTVQALEAALDEYDTLRSTVADEVEERVRTLRAGLEDLPAALDDRMGQALTALSPRSILESAPDLLSGLESSGTTTEVGERIGAWLESAVDWLQEVVDALDLEAVRGPLEETTDAVRSTVDALDGALVELGMAVESLLGEVDALLDGVDTATAVAELEQAVEGLGNDIVQGIRDLFEPARQTVAALITTLEEGVDAFDPQVVVDALRDALSAVTSVLQDPAVTSAIEEVQDALEEARSGLENLSFAPITDEVVHAIEDVAEALRSIDPAELSPPVQGALQAALVVLPPSLQPLLEPIIEEFDRLVEEGPVVLVERVREQPALLMDRIRAFEPAERLGETLAAPYRTLLQRMEAFQPSQLLEPLERELEAAKERLRQKASPVAAVEPLSELYDELLGAVDELRPSTLLAPVEARIGQGVDDLAEALPLDEIFQAVDEAVARIVEALGVGEDAVAFVQRLLDLLDDLADPGAQIDAWIQAVVADLDQMSDVSALQPHLDGLAGAVDDLREEALGTGWDALLGTVGPQLDSLDPGGRLVRVAQAHRTFPRDALDTLPASAERDAVQAVVDRFDPLDPRFGVLYRRLDALAERFAETGPALEDTLTGWDDRHHEPGGPLDDLTGLTATPEAVRDSVAEALRATVGDPLAPLLEQAGPVREVLAVFLEELQRLVTEVQAGVTDLVNGPASIQSVRDALESVVDRVRSMDLSFLTDRLDPRFETVRGKVEALDPGALAGTVETAFHDMLDGIDLGLVLPQPEIDALDQEYAAVLDGLRLLDPQVVVTDVLQPEYEATVLPLVEAFDVTPLLDTVVQRLRDLDEELRSELERVDTAYASLRDAVPDLDLSVSLSF